MFSWPFLCRQNYVGDDDFNNKEFFFVDASVACKFNNTYLVVMETERELEFIKKEFQTQRGRIHDEWHIGLTTENWTWVNGKSLTIFNYSSPLNFLRF